MNLEESQKFNVLAVPCNAPFIVSPDKTEEFLNQKANPETTKMISEMADKLKINNLVNNEEKVLKKIKK